MSKFYSEIAKYYKEIFPVGQGQIDFLRGVLGSGGGEKVLDIGCGDGGYAKSLADLGHKVTAIDLSEDMVGILNKNHKDINGLVLNMVDIHKLPGSYDLAYSIGNSLVHLEDEHQVLDFLKKAKGVLKKDGNLVLQIINYDRILNNRVGSLPTIKGPNLEFHRYYDHLEGEDKINFRTHLRVDGKDFKNIESLYPIRYGVLRDLVLKAGFKDIDFYGDFKKTSFNPNTSYMVVVRAS